MLRSSLGASAAPSRTEYSPRLASLASPLSEGAFSKTPDDASA